MIYGRKYFSSATKKRFDRIFLSPIYYVNAQPHIGHLFTGVLCDAANRYHRDLLGEETYFSIGTDEHGLKIQKKAKEAKINEFDFCS